MLANSLGIGRRLIIGVALDMAEQIKIALPKAVKEVSVNLEHNDTIMVERIVNEIRDIVKKTSSRILPETK